jgi:hypothetical protein
MRTIFTIIFCLVAVMASASPFLVSNEQATATSYHISGGPAWLPSTVQGTSINIDLANYQEGTWEIRARACKVDPVFGLQCSAEGSYTLVCPAPTGGLNAPVLRIQP